jgi:hypothetical protein
VIRDGARHAAIRAAAAATVIMDVGRHAAIDADPASTNAARTT